jgi:hypothetical protein
MQATSEPIKTMMFAGMSPRAAGMPTKTPKGMRAKMPRPCGVSNDALFRACANNCSRSAHSGEETAETSRSTKVAKGASKNPMGRTLVHRGGLPLLLAGRPAHVARAAQSREVAFRRGLVRFSWKRLPIR